MGEAQTEFATASDDQSYEDITNDRNGRTTTCL